MTIGLFGIPAPVDVNVINHLMLVNIYANCSCRRRLIGKLVEKCDEDTDGNKMIYNAALNDYGKV